MQRGCDALGWTHGALIRNAPGCEASNFCHLGCRSEARKSTNISYVPPALERGAMLFTGLKAERVLVENGRATGIEGRAANGNRVRVRARAVILAGGTVPTPLFLQAQGLANSSGQVGRNLTLHPSCGVMALFDAGDERLRPHPAGVRLRALPPRGAPPRSRPRRATTPCPAWCPPSAAA